MASKVGPAATELSHSSHRTRLRRTREEEEEEDPPAQHVAGRRGPQNRAKKRQRHGKRKIFFGLV